MTQIQDVQTSSLNEVSQTYISPLIDMTKSKVVVVADPSKVNAITSAFQK